MGNLSRKFQRRRGHKVDPKPQFTEIREDGGYLTLHPTKGWRLITAARLRAGQKVAMMLDQIITPRLLKPAKVYRKPAKQWPGTVTRQQRRYAARKGLEV